MDSLQGLLDQLESATGSAEFSEARLLAEPQILASRDAGLISQLGMIYRERRLWSEAEDVLRKAARLEPSLPTPHRSLGLLFIHRDDLAWEQSLECAKESLETAARLEKKANEPSAATHTLLGRVYLSLGERSDAEAEFRMALRIDPRYTEAKYNLATTLGQLSVPGNDEIISLLKQSIEEDPHYFAALRDLGWNLRFSNVLEAEYYLSRALQEAQDDVLVHIYYARLKFDTEPAIAEQQYKKAIELDPGDSELHQLLGLLYSHSGRNDEANRELFSALELDPDNEKLFAGYLDFLNKIKDRTYRAKLYQSAKRNSLLAPEMLQELDKSVASL